MTIEISASQMLSASGWLHDVKVSIDGEGYVVGIAPCDGQCVHSVGVLLPAPGNVHSHSFQRAMAGLAERRGPTAIDDFWTWRQVMYRFLELLSPDDIEVIAAQVQMEMLEAGYAAQAEFHYLHHAPGGHAYDQLGETSLRHFKAAELTGIGYTHLPVLYMQGGLDGRPLEAGQRRFGCDLQQFADLHENLSARLDDMPSDFNLGVAPHSLRAVSSEGLELVLGLSPDGPIHIHAAEQIGEVREVVTALGSRPVRWLLDNMPIDKRWCLIHATQMEPEETLALAGSGAVAGVCPITEANLGDGIFDGRRFLEAGGLIGIGSDSNVRIGLTEELRMLEVSQRLRDRKRSILTDDQTCSNGRYLYERATRGSARALRRNAGRIEVGALADFVALDYNSPVLGGLRDDAILDAWIFAGTDDIVTDVWSAGRHMVRDGAHVNRHAIQAAYSELSLRLRARL
jgi:formimidoylglutamate deiminase